MSDDDLTILSSLADELLHYRNSLSLPDRSKLCGFMGRLLEALFPQLSQCSPPRLGRTELLSQLFELKQDLAELLSPLASFLKYPPEETTRRFFWKLSHVHSLLKLDAEAIYKGDPAAHSIDEVILAYPGFLGLAYHRLSHELYLLDVPLIPRIIAEHSHSLTGIDIHPGAAIGRSFAIDHGTGVVIGQTTWIGNNVKIYQGVTLGALSVQKSLAGTKRHPTVEDNVVIYANATILGGDTVVGHDSIIGGNAWVTSSVPPRSKIYHASTST